MSVAPQLRVIESPEQTPELVFEVEEGHPRIPDSTYLAVCCGVDVEPTFKALKAYLRFRIAEGEHAGKVVFRAYNVAGRIIPGKGPGTGPRPKLKRTGDLFKMLCRVLHLPANAKPHRVGMRELQGRLCKIVTRTVVRDYKQRVLPDAARYSVVEDVIAVETE